MRPVTISPRMLAVATQFDGVIRVAASRAGSAVMVRLAPDVIGRGAPVMCGYVIRAAGIESVSGAPCPGGVSLRERHGVVEVFGFDCAHALASPPTPNEVEAQAHTLAAWLDAREIAEDDAREAARRSAEVSA